MSLDLRPSSRSSLSSVVLPRPFHVLQGDKVRHVSTSRFVDQFSCMVQTSLSRLRHAAGPALPRGRVRVGGAYADRTPDHAATGHRAVRTLCINLVEPPCRPSSL